MKTFWDKIACLYDLAESTNKSVNDQMAKAVGDGCKAALSLVKMLDAAGK